MKRFSLYVLGHYAWVVVVEDSFERLYVVRERMPVIEAVASCSCCS